MQRIIVVITALILGLCSAGFSQEVQGVFEQKSSEARAAYDQGNYADAIKKYLELKNQGLESAELYYNLGNAEYKSGNLGRAIAYYRWALNRAPGDDDILYNLEYSRSLIRRPEDKRSPVEKYFQTASRRFSGQSLALAALVFYIFFCVLLGVLISRRGKGLVWRWSAGIVGGIFLLLAAWASLGIAMERNVRWGVIVARQSEARNGPGPENQVGFTIPEGREVRILSREKDWVAVGLSPEGYKGWIQAADIWEDE